MMGLSPNDVGALGLYEYQSLLHHWNRAHGGKDAPEPIDLEEMQRHWADLEAEGVKVIH